MTGVLDAAYHTVHDYPGGAPALAARLGKRPAVLCHEVAPGPSNASAKFGLMDAMRIMAMTGDHRVLFSACGALGYVAVPTPEHHQTGDDAVDVAAALSAACDATQRWGELIGSVGDSPRDGRVTGNELARIAKEWGQVVAAGQHLVALVTEIHEAGKPAGC